MWKQIYWYLCSCKHSVSTVSCSIRYKRSRYSMRFRNVFIKSFYKVLTFACECFNIIQVASEADENAIQFFYKMNLEN